MAAVADQLNLSSLQRAGLGVPVLVLMLLAMMVVPLPPIALDVLFSFNISLSLMVILVVVYSRRALEFAVFPSVLLVATLLRLALNVASTRVVLLEGHTGTGAAGRVIEAFGSFVIGGNYAVGLVVFAILVIINFVVVTKGAGRISEVSARFTLDAMPGKQMAIDADLNAGLITQDEARERRDEVRSEADFYGAMDGASKFVRGDAVAGILILFINIIGGLAIGVLQHQLPVGEAVQNYTLLTIGDGLVAQIPSLLLSTAAAIMVTRVSRAEDMSQQIFQQLFGSPRVLTTSSGIMLSIGVIPGMPNFAFLTLAAVLGGLAYLRQQDTKSLDEEEAIEPEPAEQQESPESRDPSWDDVATLDIIGLEVGYRLIPLVDRKQGGQLMDRIKGVRRKLSQELGFLIPSVHIRDNLDLTPNAYRLVFMGVPVGEAEIHLDHDLAINSGQVFGDLKGLPTKDPAFGLDAIWISPDQREHAQTLGYTVVDATTVIATHLSELIKQNAHEIIGYEEVQQLLDNLAKSAPKLVENLVPETLSLGVILRVLQNLLAERIPIRDMRTIAETLAEHGTKSQDPDALTAAVRISLGRLILQNINGMSKLIPVISMNPELEQLLLQSTQVAGDSGFGLEPKLAERFYQSLQQAAQQQEIAGEPSILLVNAAIRKMVAQFIRHSLPDVHVLAYQEIPDNKEVNVVGVVG
ncbi:MAG TPA: flagellar biosynthesis protein FlhA [Gammaproteobacteria bacterium]|nr:flagellar biosynthesis protein FlhA [Gammaproteobacteria bacterium]